MNNQLLVALRRITNKLDSDFVLVYKALESMDAESMSTQLQEANEALLRMGRKYSCVFLIGVDAEKRAIITLDRVTEKLQYRNRLTFAVEETADFNELPEYKSQFVKEMLATQVGACEDVFVQKSWVELTALVA